MPPGCRRVVTIALAALVLLAGRESAMAGEAERLARTYRYHYIGEVMPTPRKAVYRDTFLPVFDIASQRPIARLFIPKGASQPARIGAQEIANRVRHLAGGKGTIEVDATTKVGGAVACRVC